MNIIWVVNVIVLFIPAVFIATVLPAKSDGDVMFVFKVTMDL